MKMWFSNLFLNPAFTFDSVQSALHAKDLLNSANSDSGCSILKIEYAKVKLQNIQIHKSHYLFKFKKNIASCKPWKSQTDKKTKFWTSHFVGQDANACL